MVLEVLGTVAARSSQLFKEHHMEVSTLKENSPAKAGPLNGLVSGAASSAHGAVDKVAAAAGSAVQTANTAIERAAQSGHQVVNKVEENVKPAERWVSEKTSALLAAPQNAAADARHYIVSHPWQSVGVALFAGVLLGRRSR
jgi:ElaB/YqjD/DUF883 family membrane-anchored ribosome-binding protein